MKKRKRHIIVFGACLLWGGAVYLSGCVTPISPDEIFRNPIDTASTNFIPPRTTIIAGPQNNQTITTDSITIRWQGNEDAVLFCYKLDTEPWSAWTTGTSALLDYLDEGTHTILIKSKHRNTTTEESTPQLITFVVDAVKGPSAMFLPRRKFVNAGDAFSYDVRAEEVSILYGARLAIRYNPAIVLIDSIEAGPMMQGNGGSAILLPTIDNKTSTALVDIAVVGRKPKGVSGSGILATLRCRALTTGSVDFTFSSSESSYRDTTNTPIPIRDLVPGKVVVR
jgi:hypothetical protein